MLVNDRFRWVVGVLPKVGGWCLCWSAGGCVAVDVEEVGQAFLGGGGVGEHASGAGAAFAAVVVEQDGFADAGEFGEQFAHRHVQSGAVGLAAHEVGDGEGQDAVEDVDADLLVGPVVHRPERDHVWVFLLPEPGFDFGLGAVGRDHVDDRPGVRLVNRIRLPNSRSSNRFRALWSVRQVSRSSVGSSPVRVTVMTSSTQRGLRIAAMSVSTAARARRVLPRASRACSSARRRRALARVWSNPRDWAACRVGEWVSTARRVTPSAVTVVSTQVRPGYRSASTGR